MFDKALELRCPGLTVVGTDTGVGKTVAVCAIARAMRTQDRGPRIAVCKPMGSGCRREREGLVHGDAEAIAHFADCREPLDVICPIRFAAPLAPAVAAEQAGRAVDWSALRRSLEHLAERHGVLVVEGIGGLLVPLDPDHPDWTVLTLAQAIGYPVVVVARSGLGTLNHTAMTVRLLREAGCRVAGVVMNGYDADAATADPSVDSNRRWIEKLAGMPVLAVLPRAPEAAVAAEAARIDPAVLDAVARVDWWGVAKPSQPISPP